MRYRPPTRKSTSASGVVMSPGALQRFNACGSVQGFIQVRVETIELLLPEAAVPPQPRGGVAHGVRDEPAAADAAQPAALDQPRALQHRVSSAPGNARGARPS